MDSVVRCITKVSRLVIALIMCGDHAHPPPFVGLSPHDWLKNFVDYYEETDTDYIELDEQLLEFKKLIRLQPDRIQCEIARNFFLEPPPNDLCETWGQNDLLIASRKIVKDTLPIRLFELNKGKFATLPVPLYYRPSDTRKQNIKVDIPGQSAKRILVSNDIVLVDIKSPYALGYAATIHSSQRLTISDTIA